MKTIIKIYVALVAVSLVWLSFLPALRAVVPPPDGGYPGFNTAEGTNALQNLTAGLGNTQQLVGIRFLRTLPGT